MIRRFVWLLLPLLLWATPAQAFPATATLDAFGRANENPLSNGGTWTAGWTLAGTDVSAILVSNHAQNNSGSVLSANWWNAASFGPDCEVWAQMGVTGGAVFHRLVLGMSNPGASYTGYQLDMSGFTGGTGWLLHRVNAGSATTVKTGAQELTNGDSFGMSRISSTITIYYKAAAGSWVALDTYTDGAPLNTSGGNVGFALPIGMSAHSISVFGGGTLTSAGGGVTFTGPLAVTGPLTIK